MRGKNSFVLYTDLYETVKQLPDTKAGILFKTILSYVNDENPDVKDLIVKIAFEPVKLQLKRDLKKWEAFIEKQKANGKKGGRGKKEDNPENPSLSLETQTDLEEPKKAVTVPVTVTDNVTISFKAWLSELNKIWDRKFKPVEKYKLKYLAAINNEYTDEEILTAAGAAILDKYHVETNYKWLTPEFICRPDKIDIFLQAAKESPTQTSTLKPFKNASGQ